VWAGCQDAVHHQHRSLSFGRLDSNHERATAAGACSRLAEQLHWGLDAGTAAGAAAANRSVRHGGFRRRLLGGVWCRYGPGNALEEPVHRERLSDVVEHAKLPGVMLVAIAFVRCEHDKGRSAPLAAEMFQHRQAAPARHHHVQNDQVWPVRIDNLLGFVAIVCLKGAIATILSPWRSSGSSSTTRMVRVSVMMAPL